jgi:diacylglycerol kinase family enzyme
VIVYYYIASAFLAFIAGIYAPNYIYTVPLLWISGSLIAVSTAYVLNRPSIFRKKQDGSIPFYIRWLFIPFLLGAQLYNLWARKHDSVPAIQKIDNNLFIACRLFPSDMDVLHQKGIKAILDVTAEFDGLDWSANDENLAYLNLPVLDHQSPTSEQLVHAINWIDMQIEKNGVIVHCALGRGRSVFVVAAYLLSKNKDWSIAQALETIQGVRKTAGLSRLQLKALKKAHESGVLFKKENLALIANPVSGGGKWPNAKDEIIQRLSAKYVVSIYETQLDISAAALTKQAILDGHHVLVACGGDGTVAEVANVLIDTNMTLGIIPLGTTNALSHVLHGAATKVFPIAVCCDVIIAEERITIDTATCNDELFLLIASIGLSQKMIASAGRTEKDEGGQLAYIKGFWDAVTLDESIILNITIDGKSTFKIETSSFVVANAAPFSTILAQGGGEPNLADGLLDITWISADVTFTEQVLNLTDLATRNLIDGKPNANIQCMQGKSVTIESDSSLSYVIDGESREAEKIIIQVKPNSLKVLG